MGRNEPLSRSEEYADRRLRLALSHSPEQESRTIVIRQGSAWQSLAFLFLCLLLIAVVLLGQYVLRGLDAKDQRTESALALAERKLQALESGMSYDASRRLLLLGMRDHILKVNAKASLSDAYLYARLALEASEKYPAVDPLLLLAIGTVESGYDPQAKSHADARGLYQIWPSTGRLLARSLGWNYDDSTLYDPEKNTEAAALYLDILFAAYNDPHMVLAEYNGGPLNAGYYRADVGALAAETRNYVPRVLDLYARLKDQFDSGAVVQGASESRDTQREGKLLGARTTAVLSRGAAVEERPSSAAPAPEPAPCAGGGSSRALAPARVDVRQHQAPLEAAPEHHPPILRSPNSYARTARDRPFDRARGKPAGHARPRGRGDRLGRPQHRRLRGGRRHAPRAHGRPAPGAPRARGRRARRG